MVNRIRGTKARMQQVRAGVLPETLSDIQREIRTRTQMLVYLIRTSSVGRMS